MDLASVVKLAKEDKLSFRRSHWEPGYVLYIDHNDDIRAPGWRKPLFSYEDILADDWKSKPDAARTSEPMSFTEALIYMRKGSRVRRLGWEDPTQHVRLQGYRFAYYADGIPTSADLSVLDVEAADWVLDYDP